MNIFLGVVLKVVNSLHLLPYYDDKYHPPLIPYSFNSQLMVAEIRPRRFGSYIISSIIARLSEQNYPYYYGHFIH